MVGRHKKYSISSISWLMEVCMMCINLVRGLFNAIIHLKDVMFYFLVVRCVVFAFRRDVQKLNPEVWLLPFSYFRLSTLSWLIFPDTTFLFFNYRLCNTFCLVCQALHFSQRMHCLYCSGQKFTIRFILFLNLFAVVFKF